MALMSGLKALRERFRTPTGYLGKVEPGPREPSPNEPSPNEPSPGELSKHGEGEPALAESLAVVNGTSAPPDEGVGEAGEVRPPIAGAGPDFADLSPDARRAVAGLLSAVAASRRKGRLC